ncbi:MAG: hypothetical protein ACRD1G_20790, partial [Acidimicrobiales bacterium]
ALKTSLEALKTSLEALKTSLEALLLAIFFVRNSREFQVPTAQQMAHGNQVHPGPAMTGRTFPVGNASWEKALLDVFAEVVHGDSQPRRSLFLYEIVLGGTVDGSFRHSF